MVKANLDDVVAECPECGETIRARKKVHIGQKITCPHCREQLAVIDSNPFELTWYDDFEDDFDYEDDYEMDDRD